VGLVVGGGAVGLFVGRKDGLSSVGAGLIEGRSVGGSEPIGAGEGGSSGSKGRLGSKSDADEDVVVVGTVFSAMGIATATITKSVRTDTRIAHFNTRRVCSVFSSSCVSGSLSVFILSFICSILSRLTETVTARWIILSASYIYD
jgi:hypothetical protein